MKDFIGFDSERPYKWPEDSKVSTEKGIWKYSYGGGGDIEPHSDHAGPSDNKLGE